MIRSGREKKYKRTMTACMNELGYTVIDWTKVPKKQPATAILAPSSARVAQTIESAEVEPAPLATTDLAAADKPGM